MTPGRDGSAPVRCVKRRLASAASTRPASAGTGPDPKPTITSVQGPPKVTFRWTAGQKPGGYDYSYFTKADNGIWVLGAPADPDEYDDVVLAHEYGHFVHENYSTFPNIGGQHGPDSRVGPAQAFQEGWATFFACAAQKRSDYLDTNAGGSFGFGVETPGVSVPRGNAGNALAGDLSEAIVAAVLYDLYDGSGEPSDTVDRKGPGVWDVFTTYMKDGGTSAFVDRGAAGRDLVDFLDGWFCLGHGEKGDDDAHGVRGIVKTLAGLSYDFVDLPACR